MELKWEKFAGDALRQIKEREYAPWFKGYTGDILLAGINYDKTKGHECVIEKWTSSH